MNVLKGACVIGQSGGPTSVINASAYGVIKTALDSEVITKVYGARFGIQGVLKDQLMDMEMEDPEELALLKTTPSSALGSCRYKLKDYTEDDTDYKRILEIFKKYDIRYFFYNGGNDSMDTCNKISKYLAGKGYACRVMGIPKTIDNDLACTDHCPGFGSAAKYIATSLLEISRDAKVYDNRSVTIVEIMGRNAGWLTAAAALAQIGGDGPDLIYLPELPCDIEKLMGDIRRVYEEKGDCLVAISEGVRDKEGRFLSAYFNDIASSKDAFGHAQMGGLAASLAAHCKAQLSGAKVRGIELSLLQRCASHAASATDIEESYQAGKTAFEAAAAGTTDKMVAFRRAEGAEYRCEMVLVDLADVANEEKKIPRAWINEAGNGVLQPAKDYIAPLILGETAQPKENGLPRLARLKKVPAKAE